MEYCSKREEDPLLDHDSEPGSEDSRAGYGLRREVGLLGSLSLIVGVMVGSGIFVSPGGVLDRSGSVATAILIWALSGFVACMGALTYAELGTMMPESGGEYLYIRRGFGGLVGYLYAFMNVTVIKPSSIAIIVKTTGQYAVQPFAESIKDDVDKIRWAENGAALIVMVLLCILNCLSVKWTSRLQTSLTFVKLVPLAAILCGGLFNLAMGRTRFLSKGFDPIPGSTGDPVTAGTVALAFFAGLWSYDGWNNLNFVTEEIKNPSRNLPLAISIGIPFTTAIYVFAFVSYLTILAPIEIINSEAVANDWATRLLFISVEDMTHVAEVVGESVIPIAMALLVMLSTIGAANGSIFAAARANFAAARVSHLPEALSMVHKTARTPIPAVITVCLMSSVFIVSFRDLDSLIDFFSFTTWIFYTLAFSSYFVLRYREPHAQRPFRVWPVVPLISVVFSAYVVVAPIVAEPKALVLPTAVQRLSTPTWAPSSRPPSPSTSPSSTSASGSPAY